MKKIILTVVMLLCSAVAVASEIRIEAETLKGQCKLTSSEYYSGGKLAGKWKSLSGSVDIPESGTWSVWVRCSALWKEYIKTVGEARAVSMRHFEVKIGDQSVKYEPPETARIVWMERKVTLSKGKHNLVLNSIGVDPYVDVLIFTRNSDLRPVPDVHLRGNKKAADGIIRQVSGQDSAKKGIVPLPCIPAPVLDGKIDEAAWSKAVTGELVLLGSGDVPRERTRYWIGCDNDNLYMAFSCSESNPSGIKRVFTHAEDRDNQIFMDDCVEVFIDPINNGVSGKFHFAINANGVFYDAFGGNKSYQSNLQLHCKVASPGWIAEIAIPFADLGMTPKGAETLMINMARERQGLPREYSCFKAGEPKTGFHHLSHFILFRPENTASEKPPVTVFSLGSEDQPELFFKNRDESDKKQYELELVTFDSAGKKLGEFRSRCAPGSGGSIKWRRSREKVAGFNYSLYQLEPERKKIYSNSFAFTQLRRVRQTMHIKEPLFESLLDESKTRKMDYSGFLWLFSYPFSSNMAAFTRQYAVAYDLMNYHELLKNIGLMPLYSPGSYNWWEKNLPEGNDIVPGVTFAFASKNALPKGLENSMTIVPEVKELYLQALREMAAKPGILAISLGDEIGHYNERKLVSYMHGSAEVHPSIVAMDKRIKTEFGRGKYGIPKAEEKDPLAWIAYRRFLEQELNKLFTDAAAEARKINPYIIIVSEDPVGNLNIVYDFSKWKNICDVVTHQLYPRNENIDYGGFLTRYLADLSGVEQVWPCPHVEEYAANFTPSEVLDELSSAIRNGANGFQYFLNDSRGRFSKTKYIISEYWGAPDRYETLMNVIKLMRTMPALKEYPRDAAVFVSTDSLRAYPGFTSLPEDEVILHGFLGNGAGVNYSFINESTLDDLKRFKIIFTANSKYIPEDALLKLERYVEQGGMLVLLDPEALSFNPEGEKLDAVRSRITGIAEISGWGSAQAMQYMGENVSYCGAKYAKVRLLPGADAAATFDDGVAIVRNRLGKGACLTFTANPCTANLAGSANWKHLFEKLSSSAGCQVKSPIWRFRLPEKLAEYTPQKVAGVCHTGNHISWSSFKMDQSCNSDVSGHYSFAPQPDYIKDASAEQISFSSGKLTDRARAALAKSAALGATAWWQWVVGYKPGDSQITVNFAFNKKVPVKRARLWVCGDVREYEFSAGGKKTAYRGKWRNGMLMEMIDLELPENVTTDNAQIKISGGSNTLIIAEAEVWSE